MTHVQPDQGEHVAGGITEEENNTIRKWKGWMGGKQTESIIKSGDSKEHMSA